MTVPMCIVCRYGGGTVEEAALDSKGRRVTRFGLTEFDEGWFHVEANHDGGHSLIRDCRARYERIVAELRPRYGYNAGTERWAEFLEERPDYNPIIGNVGHGWIGLVVNLTEALLLEHPDLQLVQLKEKFGGMRYYTNGLNEVGHALVGWAEHMSYKYCEECGQFGESRDGGWIKILCDDCHERRTEIRRQHLESVTENYDPDLYPAMGLVPDRSEEE